MKTVLSWGAAALVLIALVVGGVIALNGGLDNDDSGPVAEQNPGDGVIAQVPIPVVPVPQAAPTPGSKLTPRADERSARAEARVEYVEGQMKEVHKTILQEMRNPWAYLYYEPVMKDGKMVGLQFTAPEEREFLRQHGLDLGDVIIGINGHDLDGGMGLAQAVTALTQDEHLSLRVRRGDRTFTVQASTGSIHE